MVSDDGSRDTSRDLVRRFASARPEGQVTLLDGPQAGATANFRSLVHARAHSAAALAFCDQDDVWLAHHLTRALARMGDAADLRPWIGGGRMVLCDASLRRIGLSPLHPRPPGFGNALVQNVLSGNTMVMNAAAARLLSAAEAEAGDFVLHDWWAYQIVTGAGGVADHDPEPTVLYRQHGENLVGANQGLAALPRRMKRHFGGDYARWHRRNAAALAASAHRFTKENRDALAAFAGALESPLPARLLGLGRAGVFHQRPGATLAFWLSAVLGRV